MNKALRDENLPVKLNHRLHDICEIYTVKDKGWNALENGDLLTALEKDGFDYLITSDKNLQHHQNLIKYSICFIILNVMNNNYETILPLVEKIKKVLTSKSRTQVMIID